MTDLEKRIKAKIPGEDTGITVKSTCCDICAPGPHCGVDLYIKDGKIIKVEGAAGHPSGNGKLCTRGSSGRQYCYREDRIKTPLKKVNGEFVPISWDDAFSLIGEKLNSLKAESGAESVCFYSGYSKWYRPYLQRLCYSFGSPNYGTESSSCFMATTMSWKLAAGYDAVNPDMGNAGVFIGWCCNPYHGVYLMAQGLEARKKAGMKIIIIDPRVTHSAQHLADLHLRPRPGTDGFLALGIARELIVNDWYDKTYVAENVYGFEEYRKYVMNFIPEYVEEKTGVPVDQIKLCARMMWENSPVTIHQSSAAIVHHKNGLQNHRAVMSLLAIMGSFDRPGGVIPNSLTYAHSMGGFDTKDEEFAKATYPQNAPLPVGCERFPLWNRLVGEMQACDLSRQILEGTPYKIRGLVAHGMNYRMFNASEKLKSAIEKLDFFVDIDLFMTDSAKLADVVLPACTSYERGEFKVYGGGFVQYTEPAIDTLYESKPDTWIITEMARRIAPQDKLLCSGYDECLKYIVSDLDIDLDELKSRSQRPIKIENFRPIPPGQHEFRTPTGKFELYSTIIADLGLPQFKPLPEVYDNLDPADPEKYPFVMIAGPRLPNALHSRGHDVPWLRSLRPEPMADISIEDAEKLNVVRGDMIEISTLQAKVTVRANLSERIMPGTLTLYHGYREADVNSLISSDHNDPYSGFPGYNSFRCNVRKVVSE